MFLWFYPTALLLVGQGFVPWTLETSSQVIINYRPIATLKARNADIVSLSPDRQYLVYTQLDQLYSLDLYSGRTEFVKLDGKIQRLYFEHFSNRFFIHLHDKIERFRASDFSSAMEFAKLPDWSYNSLALDNGQILHVDRSKFLLTSRKQFEKPKLIFNHPDSLLFLQKCPDMGTCYISIAHGFLHGKYYIHGAYAKDGVLLGYCSILDESSGRLVKDFRFSHLGLIRAIIPSHSGDWIMIGAVSNSFPVIVDVASGKYIQPSDGDVHDVRACCFSVTGSYFLVPQEDLNRLKIYSSNSCGKYIDLSMPIRMIIPYSLNSYIVVYKNGQIGQLVISAQKNSDALDFQQFRDLLIKPDLDPFLLIKFAANAKSIKYITRILMPSETKIAGLVHDLNSDRYKIRRNARTSLTKIGPTASAELTAALATATADQQDAILQVLQLIRNPESGARLLQERSVEILCIIGTAESRELLIQCAKLDEKSELSARARTAIKILNRFAITDGNEFHQAEH